MAGDLIADEGARYGAEVHVTGEQQVGAALGEMAHGDAGASYQVADSNACRKVEGMMRHDDPGDPRVERAKFFSCASNLAPAAAAALPRQGSPGIDPYHSYLLIQENGLQVRSDV